MSDTTVRRERLGVACAVPNSSGTEPPRTPAPAGACDAHIHVIDPRFPMAQPAAPDGATIADYHLFQARIGTERAVLVQAKLHGTNNDALLDAVARLGPNGRGVAVVLPDVSDAELRRLDRGGVRGLRFSVWNAGDTVTTIDMIEPLAKRIADLGWHAQIHMGAEQIVSSRSLLERLPCPIVFDHMGRLPPGRGPDHPAFGVIASLLERQRAWVKLSGAYLNSASGPPDYLDASRSAEAYARLEPSRLVWGSDWPHLTETHKPDDAGLFDLARDWVTDEATFEALLVDNPARLYDF